MLGQPVAGGVLQFDPEIAVGKLEPEFAHQLVDDQPHGVHLERLEDDPGVDPVAELRREQTLDGRLRGGLGGELRAVAETHRLRRQLPAAGVRRHDQDDVPEVRLAAVVVGQGGVVHDLEQDVVDVRVGLLDFVQQQDRVRRAANRVGQQAALVEADVARRRADQPRHGVLLHVLAHVEAGKRDAEHLGELAGEFRLADPGGTREEEAADRPLQGSETGATQLHGRRDRADRLVLAEDDRLELLLQVEEGVPVVAGDGLLGNLRHRGDDPLHVDRVEDALALLRRHQAVRGAGLVDEVDRLVGQAAVEQVAGREVGGGVERFVRVLDLVVLLVAVAQAAQDLRRLLDRRFLDLDHLEAAGERAVAVERTLVLGVGGRADAAQLAGGEARLQDVRGIERAGGHRAGADDRVDLVDEQDVIGLGDDPVDHRLQALLEVASVARAREQGAHVKRVDSHLREKFRHVLFVDRQRKPLDDRRLADPRIADQDRVVLAPAGQRLAEHPDFVEPPDQRIDRSLGGSLVQVGGELLQRVLDLFLLLAVGVWLDMLWCGKAAALLDRAVGEVADDVEALDVLALEQVDRLGFLLAHQRCDHRAGVQFALAGAVGVHGRPFDDAPERDRLLGRRFVFVAGLRAVLGASVLSAVHLG